MTMINRVFITLCVLLSGSVHAQQFQAPITDTHWQVIESPLECSLSQHIPDFGTALFKRATGDSLRMIFTSDFYPANQNNAQFEIAKALWQNSDERISLLSVPTEKGQTRFEVAGELAKQALTHLREGRIPALRYSSPNAFGELDILMSTVHLAESIDSFQQCVDSLHPDTFEDVRKLTIHFGLEKYNLNANAQAAVTRVADYVKLDDRVKRIIITGHTDNHGRKRLNGPLSENRAKAVKQYLVEKCGIPENLITIKSKVEREPLATNKTHDGRALNRRAVIELKR